jgi:soluble lytic murein transglycosylase-like protein
VSDGGDDLLLLLGLGLLGYAAYAYFGGGGGLLSGDNVSTSGSALDAATLAGLANQASGESGVRPELILADILQESGGNPSAIGDGGRAIGLMQMHAAAASDVGVNWSDLAGNPELQAIAGASYLAQQINRFGDERTGLIAYNQGASVADNSADARYVTGAAYADAVLARIPTAQAMLAGGGAAPSLSQTFLDLEGI